MTSTRVRPHVARVLERTRAVLLPFDGTLCDLFAGVDTAAIAERIRARFFARGHRMSLLTSIVTDPLEMLAYAYHVSWAYGTEAEEIVRDAEIAAARTAVPTPGAHEVLLACQAGGRAVAVVGDTCSAAMAAHLDTHDLRHLAGPVIGREQRWPSSKEPAGVALVRQAVKALGTKPSDCALVSLSPQGMFVAADAGTRAIGVVSQHTKRKHLAAIGDSVVVSSLPQLAGALTAVPPAETFGAPTKRAPQ
ncbi:beta-phosphoglucomutase-like phosphatase (HAD superfamily) [Streptosporangium becharense]|uniref:Beta-phosphoglucomutase-like phosphatase (HAD superfamily) n=1 Tax=Streptosporangium becharense TaxID=1816182 RepID=A0A7W9IK25_9ACTN|nr:HAD family phosphatase [Streptosporangium becharense]MBB2911399.1 beta-phosphoglucomutase-like phosphatase (HAD superfamily) [Streptosporangium becharense]MBB5821543.1 beta-phosphoglucomutase-like phosphatase (HAD superfamily) [Streptosporangium becharense]